MPRDAALVRSASTFSNSALWAPAQGVLAEFYSLTEEGQWAMVMYFGMWTLAWIVAFYCCSSTEPCWAGRFPKSTKRHENDKNWSARVLIGIIHAAFISCITVPAIFVLYPASDDVRFGSTGHLADCHIGPEQAEIAAQWSLACEAVALAGIAFTAFTLADVGISLVHGLATADYIAHHIAFITAGLIIRGHCMLPFNAAILLSMEASTPFLNVLSFFRHRGSAYKTVVQVNGALFVVLFVVFRLILNIYGAVALWYHRHMFPPTVPKWQVWFLLVAVAAGAGVQLFWFPLVCKSFGKELVNSFRRGTREASDPGAESLLQGSPASGDGSASSLSNTITDYGSNNEDNTPAKEADAPKKSTAATSE